MSTGRAPPPVTTSGSRVTCPPFFLITIDTEGDNLWARPREVTTRNAAYLPRFQQLCEKHGLKPTYLTDYDMARSDEFVEFATDAQRRGMAEIGMHLHAWSTPPGYALTGDDHLYHPYLIEYPEPVLREMVARMTGLLEERFGVPMRSHRAGRWAFNAVYARALAERGYRVDCSVTPHVSWRSQLGDPAGSGGVDYSGFPSHAYLLDHDDISRPGDSPLLEVPMSIMPPRLPAIGALRSRWPADSIAVRIVNRLSPPPSWLRPNGRNLHQLLAVIEWACRQNGYAEFMLHSSEFMPGGSPTFRTAGDIERLYDHLEALFEAATQRLQGGTLSEFHRRFAVAGGEAAA